MSQSGVAEADERFMRMAINLAHGAESAGEVPVGALLVRSGEIIGEGRNQSVFANDPTAHAEIIALRAASQRVSNYRLANSTLYVTIEPCAMCAGALVHARVERLVFAAREARAGAVVSNLQLLDQPFLNHRVAWSEGFCAVEAAELIRNFFRSRRGN